jgi:hypothetical protein
VFTKRTRAHLLEVESKIDYLLVQKPTGTLSEEEKSTLKELMANMNVLLSNEEIEWCLKSRAVWLK